jgi:hypothetical protein
MRPKRCTLLALPLLLALGACAGMRDDGASPPARLAASLEASDPVVSAVIAGMDAFERRAWREERAVAFALGRTPAAPRPDAAPPPGAAEAAGDVIAPAFTALGDYAHILGQLAAGHAPDPRPSPGGEALASSVAQALPRVEASIAPARRDAGLAGIAALPALAMRADGRGPDAAEALTREAAPHVTAITVLLTEVIGPRPGTATRGAIRARREAMEAAHLRLLEAVRREQGLGASGRYALYHRVAALRDQDPLPGSFTAIVSLLGAIAEAHAALVAGAPAAEARIAGLEAALARLSALSGQDTLPPVAE